MGTAPDATTMAPPRSITFVVTEAVEGGYTAAAHWPDRNRDLVTEGDDLDDLRRNVRECVAASFDDDEPRPQIIHLHFIRDEVLAA